MCSKHTLDLLGLLKEPALSKLALTISFFKQLFCTFVKKYTLATFPSSDVR
jgi:hypothetical protein